MLPGRCSPDPSTSCSVHRSGSTARRKHHEDFPPYRFQFRTILEEIAAEIRSLGFHAQTVSLTGYIEQEVLGLATREGADLIVLGTAANRGIERLMAGSDAEALIRKAACPVLVIGPGVLPPPSEPWHPKSIACAVDLSVGSAPIVAAASSLAEQYHADFMLLHIEEISQKSSASRISEFASALGDLIPQVSEVIKKLQTRLSDSPGYAIADYAMEQKTDLLVMGVHSTRAPITHFFRGIAPPRIRQSPLPRLNPSREQGVRPTPHRHGGPSSGLGSHRPLELGMSSPVRDHFADDCPRLKLSSPTNGLPGTTLSC